MPVEIYVRSDAKGRPAPAAKSHEIEGCFDILKRLWLTFSHQDTFYAVVVGVEEPSADLVILSERGIGIMELKHYFGHISVRRSTWFAEEIEIKAGSKNKAYKNPHEQVQDYASRIRDMLIKNPSQRWLPGNPNYWKDFVFNTAVCFTHPDAFIRDMQHSLRRKRSTALNWEAFKILKPDDVPTWAASLNFGKDVLRKDGSFVPASLNYRKITEVVTQLFDAVEWTEVIDLMPKGAPYAYLHVIENNTLTMTFSLDHEEMTIGRGLDCDIVIPVRFENVSRKHACIIRSIDGIYFEDSSRNGSFVNGRRRHRSFRLKPGHRILLGGREPGKSVCELEFFLNPKEPGVTQGYFK